MLVPSVSESNFWNLNQIFLNKKEKNHPSWLFENYLNANFNRVIFTLFIALVYLIGARIGQVLSIPPGNVTPIWPPSGVAMAVILMYGYSIWPGIFFGALLGNTWAFLDPTNFHTMVKTTSAGAIIGMGATLQAVCGAYLINHVIKDNQPFNKFINVVQFFIPGIVSCLISSTIGSIALSLFGIDEWKHFLKIWSTWFLGDSTGILIFAPFLLVWFRYPLIQLQKTEKIHLFFFILLLCIASLFIFLLPYNLIYVFIPFLIYGAFRFGLYGATLSVLIAALVSNSLTILGYGPFIYRTLNESLLTLQMFIGIIALTTLIVSALLEELKENRLTLEVKVAEKTANLALTIEKMKEMQNQMITQEKLTSLGIICSGIAHEIKNPLNFINNFSVLTLKLIEDLEGNFQSRDYSDIFDIIKKNIRSVLEQGKKADYIVEKMFLHGSQSGREFKLVI